MINDGNDEFRKAMKALLKHADKTPTIEGFDRLLRAYCAKPTYTDEEIRQGLLTIMAGGSVSPPLATAIHLKYDHAIPGFECDCDQPKPENVVKGKFPRKKTKTDRKKAIEIPFKKP